MKGLKFSVCTLVLLSSLATVGAAPSEAAKQPAPEKEQGAYGRATPSLINTNGIERVSHYGYERRPTDDPRNSELEDPHRSLASLVSTNLNERTAGLVELAHERDYIVLKLVEVLRGTHSDEVKRHAVAALGYYRAKEAAPWLVEHLDMDNKFRAGGFSMQVPAVVDALEAPVSTALCAIGIPALPALEKKIAQTDDASIRLACVRIWLSILDIEAAKPRLEYVLQIEKDPTRKARIQSALEQLEKRIVESREWDRRIDEDVRRQSTNSASQGSNPP
jgi:hypothetical protein